MAHGQAWEPSAFRGVLWAGDTGRCPAQHGGREEELCQQLEEVPGGPEDPAGSEQLREELWALSLINRKQN